MDRGAWRAAVHGVTELGTTDLLALTCDIRNRDMDVEEYLKEWPNHTKNYYGFVP